MGIFHDEFVKTLEEVLTSPSIKIEVLRLILKKHGCSLSDDQLQSLISAAEQGEDSVNLPDDSSDRTISISTEDIEEAIREFDKKVEASTENAINSTVQRLAPNILKSLYDTLPLALKEWHSMQRVFEKRLRQRWKSGLDRLDMLITMSHEAGELYVEDIHRGSMDIENSQEHLLVDVLTALHCRACRIAREIVCLLKAGYADGAHARWRSLHELAVIAFFLIEHRGDTPQRYLDHIAVERWRAAREYQQHCSVLGHDPFSIDELAEMEKESEAMIDRYGASFKEDYGWASEILGVSRPTFTQIEKSLQMAHWRPYFRLACQSVHAGSRGLYFSLGLPTSSNNTLLAGASDAGLADPGHQMAISLTMVTVAFLTAAPNLDGLITCHCLLALCDDIGEELIRTHESTA